MISRFLAVVTALLLAATGCTDEQSETPSQDVLTGTVLAVDARSLTAIDSFTLKAGEEQLEIYIDEGRDYSGSGFLPQHLREHVISAVQVRVEVERRGERLIALGMQDA